MFSYSILQTYLFSRGTIFNVLISSDISCIDSITLSLFATFFKNWKRRLQNLNTNSCRPRVHSSAKTRKLACVMRNGNNKSIIGKVTLGTCRHCLSKNGRPLTELSGMGEIKNLDSRIIHKTVNPLVDNQVFTVLLSIF